jgi:hypothetical protein
MLAVYVDNFLLAAVENQLGSLLSNTMRATLHAVHSIIPAPTATDAQGTKDSISEKKLNKGDACWDIVQEVLGCKVNGESRTI